jgi:hypothetical protein
VLAGSLQRLRDRLAEHGARRICRGNTVVLRPQARLPAGRRVLAVTNTSLAQSYLIKARPVQDSAGADGERAWSHDPLCRHLDVWASRKGEDPDGDTVSIFVCHREIEKVRRR